MKKKMTKMTAIILCLLMSLSLISCGTGGSRTVDKVVMTYVSEPLNVPSVIEREEGTFKKAFEEMGLGLEYKEISSGADQTMALASGDIHILNGVGGSSVILAAANDADIAVISMYSMAPGAFAMYSNDASLNSPEDLAGKTVAGPKGTNLHELLAAYLATANMKTEDVNFVSMDIPSAVAALESGSIDVALVGGAAAYNMEKSGKHKIADGEGLIPATIVTATSRAFANANPEIIEKFKKTQQAIVDSMNQNTDDALAMTAKALDLEEDATAEMFAMYDFDTQITDEKLGQFQKTADFLYESGMIEKNVDVKELIL